MLLQLSLITIVTYYHCRISECFPHWSQKVFPVIFPPPPPQSTWEEFTILEICSLCQNPCVYYYRDNFLVGGGGRGRKVFYRGVSGTHIGSAERSGRILNRCPLQSIRLPQMACTQMGRAKTSLNVQKVKYRRRWNRLSPSRTPLESL